MNKHVDSKTSMTRTPIRLSDCYWRFEMNTYLLMLHCLGGQNPCPKTYHRSVKGNKPVEVWSLSFVLQGSFFMFHIRLGISHDSGPHGKDPDHFSLSQKTIIDFEPQISVDWLFWLEGGLHLRLVNEPLLTLPLGISKKKRVHELAIMGHLFKSIVRLGVGDAQEKVSDTK